MDIKNFWDNISNKKEYITIEEYIINANWTSINGIWMRPKKMGLYNISIMIGVSLSESEYILYNDIIYNSWKKAHQKSEHWLKFKQQVIYEQDGLCAVSGCNNTIDLIHHHNYDREGHELRTDCCGLCKIHHIPLRGLDVYERMNYYKWKPIIFKGNKMNEKIPHFEKHLNIVKESQDVNLSERADKVPVHEDLFVNLNKNNNKSE